MLTISKKRQNEKNRIISTLNKDDDDTVLFEKPEQLTRRQMRLLHPGDRICTIRSRGNDEDDEEEPVDL